MRNLNFFMANRSLNNQRGVAALMSVIMALLIMALIGFSFLIGVRQKQSGASLTYTSGNAQFVAEAGLRYGEKCIRGSDPLCPCNNPGNCTNWAALANFPPITFAGAGNSFDVSFTFVDAGNVRILSKGTFRGATRFISKNVHKRCNLANNAATSCKTTKTKDSSVINGPISQNSFCPNPDLVDPVVLPGNPAGCPNAQYPDFNPAIHLDGNGFLTQFQFCDFKPNNITVKTNPGDVLWVANKFELKGTTIFQVNGNVTVNSQKDIKFKDDSQTIVNGTLTLHANEDIKVEKNAQVNVTSGNPKDVLALAGKDFKVKDNAIFIGAVIANNKIKMEDNGQLTGAVLSNDKIELKNNAVINYDRKAGSRVPSYFQCLQIAPLVPDWNTGQ